MYICIKIFFKYKQFEFFLMKKKAEFSRFPNTVKRRTVVQFSCLLLGVTGERKRRLRYFATAEQVSEPAANFLKLDITILVICNLRESGILTTLTGG